MAISYNGLWKQLIDHGMKKGDLCAKTGLSSSTIAKMTNCESVKLSVLEKICKELDCNFGDLIDYVPDNKKVIPMEENVNGYEKCKNRSESRPNMGNSR